MRFENYLIGRIHRVKNNKSDQFSEWQTMLGGIPQNSSLGPLLFPIDMNKLPLQITNGLSVQYADNTTLIWCGPTLAAATAQMNPQLQLISEFISDSRMMLSLMLCGEDAGIYSPPMKHSNCS